MCLQGQAGEEQEKGKQIFAELLGGTRPVADVILDFQSQLGEGLIVAIRTEDRVVAEALCAALLAGDFTLDDALEAMHFLDAGATAGADVFLLYERNHGAKACAAIVVVAQFAQQLLHVGLRVVALAAGIAGAIDAWCAVQRIYLKARIVGKAVHVVVVIHVLGLLQGILFERLSCLRNIGVTADVLEREHFNVTSQYLSNLLQLVLVVGCEYYFHRCSLLLL